MADDNTSFVVDNPQAIPCNMSIILIHHTTERYHTRDEVLRAIGARNWCRVPKCFVRIPVELKVEPQVLTLFAWL